VNIRIVTDSTADLPEEEAAKHKIAVVPLNVILGGESYRDGIDITADQFYERLLREHALATTSQPSPAAFVETYERLLSEGADQIVSVHISARLSGTFHSAQLARDAMDASSRVHVIDSRTVSLPLAMIAVSAARQGRSENLDGVLAGIHTDVERNTVLFMADTLEYVRRGGRIGRASALLGSVLQIKPILTLDDGEVSVAARPRTRARALEEMLRLTLSRPAISRIGIAHTTSRDDAEKLRLAVLAHLPDVPIMMGRLGPVLGAHVGPGSLGMCYFEGSPDEREFAG
jgi:DegV family protein with EDD domain